MTVSPTASRADRLGRLQPLDLRRCRSRRSLQPLQLHRRFRPLGTAQRLRAAAEQLLSSGGRGTPPRPQPQRSRSITVAIAPAPPPPFTASFTAVQARHRLSPPATASDRGTDIRAVGLSCF